MLGCKMRLILLLICSSTFLISVAEASVFTDNFQIYFGDWNVKYPGRVKGNTVILGLTNSSGSGFRSKIPFLFGRLTMKIKLPANDSAGTVTSYYMASTFKKWCELDFEFLGNRSGQPYILQTNVFVEGKGEREQRIFLWFDPTTRYHEYGIVWNQNLVIFIVDNIPIRVFHNQKNTTGQLYLDYQPMYIWSSLFDGDSWATRGGLEKINWSKQPFQAYYTSFNIANSCQVTNCTGVNNCYKQLYQSSYGNKSLQLTSTQITQLRWVRRRWIIYDYCTDLQRWSGVVPVECVKNRP
ncbi:hypothetical protein R1flu_001327 [Riccia fluitans]|uniref:Xyloglucan endotransglucosylase/hydrolase n=1 Tax=Riccia fluitans TaxID=41844 RepID=A0ABD1Y679_9MARC